MDLTIEGIFMRKLILFTLFSLFSFSVLASPTMVITPLGQSRKGQYVALEDYHYNVGKNKIKVRIRFLNAWKNKYSKEEIIVEKEIQNEASVKLARDEAKELAQEMFEKYNIRS